VLSTVLELVAFVCLMVFAYLAAGWVGAVLLGLVVVFVLVSFRFEP